MTSLIPLQTLYDTTQGDSVPLPPELAALYGRLAFPRRVDAQRPYIIGNFVSTLDGIVSLNVPGQSGGGPISGYNQHDRMVMGILRAAADAVIIGAGTVRAVSPKHIWSAEYIYPSLADAYAELRRRRVQPLTPLNVVVTARGDLDLNRGVFRSGDVPVLIVTTQEGATRLACYDLPPWVRLATTACTGSISAQAILDAINAVHPSALVLVEGGPRLIGDFFADRCLDELFLTFAPQIAGRENDERPTLVSGKQFAPEHPVWGTLTALKQWESHLFLRYQFTSEQ